MRRKDLSNKLKRRKYRDQREWVKWETQSELMGLHSTATKSIWLVMLLLWMRGKDDKASKWRRHRRRREGMNERGWSCDVNKTVAMKEGIWKEDLRENEGRGQIGDKIEERLRQCMEVMQCSTHKYTVLTCWYKWSEHWVILPTDKMWPIWTMCTYYIRYNFKTE